MMKSPKGVMWTSSKSTVATVSNGVVTAVAPGTATITAKTLDGSYTATCTVTAKEEQLPSDEYTNIDDYLTYTTTAGKATITGVTSTISGDVTFSATIDGYPINLYKMILQHYLCPKIRIFHM